jgi:uncharacterized protein YgiM (DUF1202 family)
MKSLIVAVLLTGGVLVSADAVQAGSLAMPLPTPPSPYVAVAAQEMVVTGTAVNLRAAPSTSGKVLTKLNTGAKVMVVGSSGSWTRVKYKTYEGYISTRFLK